MEDLLRGVSHAVGVFPWIRQLNWPSRTVQWRVPLMGHWHTGWARGSWFSWGTDRQIKLWGLRKSPFSMIHPGTTTNPPVSAAGATKHHALLHCSSMPQDCQWVKQSSKCQSMGEDLLVPVTLGVLVECWKHDREDFGCIIADQAHDIFIVPIVQCSLCHLQRERKSSLKRLLPVTPVVHREATTQPRSPHASPEHRADLHELLWGHSSLLCLSLCQTLLTFLRKTSCS